MNLSERRRTYQDVDRMMLAAAGLLPKLRMMAGSPLAFYYSTAVVASPAAAAATVICTTQGFNPPRDSSIIALVGYAAFTAGTAAVTATLKIVQGAGASDTAVGNTGATTVVATHLYALPVMGVDTPGRVNDFQYSLTLTMGSGSAESAVSAAMLLAICG